MAAEFAGNPLLILQHTISRHFTNPDLNISLYSSLFSSSPFMSLSTRKCQNDKTHFRRQIKAQRLTQHTVLILHLLFSSYMLSSSVFVRRTPWALGVDIILQIIHISFHTDSTARSYNGNKRPWLEVTGELGRGGDLRKHLKEQRQALPPCQRQG